MHRCVCIHIKWEVGVNKYFLYLGHIWDLIKERKERGDTGVYAPISNQFILYLFYSYLKRHRCVCTHINWVNKYFHLGSHQRKKRHTQHRCVCTHIKSIYQPDRGQTYRCSTVAVAALCQYTHLSDKLPAFENQTNTLWNFDKYILKFLQIHLAIKTNTF